MTIREFGRSVSNSVLRQIGRAASQVQENRPLPTDLLESDDAYLAVFDAPGATHADVQVRYDDGAVKVRLDRFREFHEGFDMRIPGRGMALDGQVKLPADALVDAESATATLRKNGTLEVEVPKAVPDGDEASDAGDTDTVTIAEPDDGTDDGSDDDPETSADDAGET
ncbi:Hsp20/alpha crystallin family protein [Haloarchaeobius iranensis]|uniref:Molecular chaperone IbpA, HSP20 family n=1 Tax=Haloarchaeobius iranensis TaxID=996166 RepID=A0A1G9TAM1_9EURY|nr:Hsp20/alpha crystallin family protein [Haloarchaeobius iranensis]SDM44662.1 Molecular chaperone IbpA, HSP20 family [Haloarchaeobius iranensis]